MIRLAAISLLITAVSWTALEAKPDKERACELAKWELEPAWIGSCELASCQIEKQSGRTFHVSMECMVDTMGHRARVKKQISFDPTPQLSQFQKDLKSVMECRADGPYRSQFASPDRFDPTSLHSLLQNEHRFKNQGEGKAVSDSFDIFDTSLGGVYFHQAEIMAGDGGSLAMLIAEPGATVESVRKALGWQRTNMSVPGFVRKIRKDKSGVVAMCMYVDPNERKVVAPAGLVMRERPSSSAPQSRMAAIGPVQNQPVLIPNGAIVSLRGCKGQRETVGDQQGTWCEIVYSPAMGMGAQGWVFGAVLEEIDY